LLKATAVKDAAVRHPENIAQDDNLGESAHPV